MRDGLALAKSDHGKRDGPGGPGPGSVTTFPLPVEVADRLRAFLLDKSSGNFELNIKDGAIRGFRVTEHHNI